MTLKEARELARRYNKYIHLTAQVVRILPEEIDPPKPEDKGWDVEVQDNSLPPISGEGWSF
jgi:hypothetical protein